MQGSVMGKEEGAGTMLGSVVVGRAVADREKKRVARRAVGCILRLVFERKRDGWIKDGIVWVRM